MVRQFQVDVKTGVYHPKNLHRSFDTAKTYAG